MLIPYYNNRTLQNRRMDLNFLRMLQFMAKVEKDPDFRSKKYVLLKDQDKTLSSEFGALSVSDKGAQQTAPSSCQVPVVDGNNPRATPDPRAIPFVPKHPENVLFVASPTSVAPPPEKGERRFTRLTEAFRCANVLAKLGCSGCSIVIYPGLYIVPELTFVSKV